MYIVQVGRYGGLVNESGGLVASTPESVIKLSLGFRSIDLLYETTILSDRASLYKIRKDCQQYDYVGIHDVFLPS